ncbi:MAG TPA: hypothetical protein ENJ37_06340, partial [Deltaproteobacteria bacterium]|nr:hypothetical protein [Deltaproteobacteria bacterium]
MSDGESTERLRVLVVTDLFPSVQDPHRAPFVLQALQYMGAHCDIRVLAPLSWVTWLKRLARGAPGGAARGWTGFGGVRCTRPLYFYLPKIGRSFYGIMYFLSIIGTVLRVRREWDFDAVVGVFAYPDGFASTLAARMLGKPAFLWVVGTDVNVYARYAVRRRMILWAVRSCRATVAASAALKQRLVELGAPADRIDVIYNGVNTAVFN